MAHVAQRKRHQPLIGCTRGAAGQRLRRRFREVPRPRKVRVVAQPDLRMTLRRFQQLLTRLRGRHKRKVLGQVREGLLVLDAVEQLGIHKPEIIDASNVTEIQPES